MVVRRPPASWRAWLNDAAAGLTWRGVLIIALVCIFHSVQDSFAAIFMVTPAKALLVVLNKSFSSFVSALIIVFTVLAALNRHPVPNAGQVAAVALAVLGASLVGAVLKLHWNGLPWHEVKPSEWYNQDGHDIHGVVLHAPHHRRWSVRRGVDPEDPRARAPGGTA